VVSLVHHHFIQSPERLVVIQLFDRPAAMFVRTGMRSKGLECKGIDPPITVIQTFMTIGVVYRFEISFKNGGRPPNLQIVSVGLRSGRRNGMTSALVSFIKLTSITSHSGIEMIQFIVDADLIFLFREETIVSVAKRKT
jgi:hypothetical protein